MSITVTQLIAGVGGDDALSIQPLDKCATSLNWSAKSGTKITFVSDVRITPNGTEDLGIIVWFPREAVAEFLAKDREEQSS